MRVPVVALVGRPNVGKSTLFNRLLQRRLAVVDDTPGVTRDRQAGQVEWSGRTFFLIDTGGWLPEATRGMEARIAEQVTQALSECDAVVFLVDAREGLQPLDEEIARALRRLPEGVQVILLANKVDSDRWEAHTAEFAALGWGDPLPVSAAQGRGVGDVLDALLAQLPPGGSLVAPEEGIRIAVLGRPNVGKSSLTNALLGRERMIVDPVPGTTRDAVDVPLRWHGQTLWLIDTAGLRHRLDRLPAFEFYASVRTMRALERCDVALLMLDASQGLTRQDQRIASLVQESGRAAVILMNKWDLVPKDGLTAQHMEADLRAELTFLDYAPMLFVSALTAQRVSKIPELAVQLYEDARRTIKTHDVNRVLERAIERTPPRGGRGKRRPKILYGTQVGTGPPAFALFTRHSENLSAEYLRFLGRTFREAFGFVGSPLRFHVRAAPGRTPARGRKGSGRR